MCVNYGGIKILEYLKYVNAYIKWNIIPQLKKGNPAICDHMDGPWGYYAKWNKAEQDEHCVISRICGILKIQTHKEIRLDGWQGWGSREKWVQVINEYKPVVLR